RWGRGVRGGAAAPAGAAPGMRCEAPPARPGPGRTRRLPRPLRLDGEARSFHFSSGIENVKSDGSPDFGRWAGRPIPVTAWSSDNRESMPLRDEIAELLRMPENGAGAPSLDAIESTLTDGYAAKLELEAERSRIERRLGEVARDAGEVSAHSVVAELAELSERLDTAEGELAGLRSLLRNLQGVRRRRRAAVSVR